LVFTISATAFFIILPPMVGGAQEPTGMLDSSRPDKRNIESVTKDESVNPLPGKWKLVSENETLYTYVELKTDATAAFLSKNNEVLKEGKYLVSEKKWITFEIPVSPDEQDFDINQIYNRKLEFMLSSSSSSEELYLFLHSQKPDGTPLKVVWKFIKS